MVPHFIRLLHDWEVEEVERFLQLKEFHFQEDILLSKKTEDGCFSVKTFTRFWTIQLQFLSLFDSLGTPRSPLRQGFFAQEASRDRVLILDQLIQRGRHLAHRCFLNEEDEETMEHLLEHCLKARML